MVAERLPDYPSPALSDRVLDMVFPPMCVGCRKIGRWICASCWQRTPWIMAWTCLKCRTIAPPGTCRCSPESGNSLSVAVVAEFEGVAREAVHALKFNGRFAIKGMMGELMGEVASGEPYDAVVPLPLHRSRRRERGYDQAAMLAHEVARSLHAPRRDELVRTRATKQQALLEREERAENIAGAFRARRTLHGESILLVDDVMTTGATLESAARTLVEAGAGTVRGAVFASAS